MKKGLLILMLITGVSAFAQSGFGVKGGLNYADNGEIEFEDTMNAVENTESKIGYHFGVYYRASMAGFFVKPELLYTTTTSSFEFNDQSADYNITKLDLPILVGARILGPLNIFAGPALQYILENDFEGVALNDLENKFTVGAQFGAGIQLGSLGVDIRYERALTDNETQVLDSNNLSGISRVDTRPNQFILSLSIDL